MLSVLLTISIAALEEAQLRAQKKLNIVCCL